MAGAGFKTWATGDVLTASDQNTYLMEQSVMVFADSTARDAAVTSPTEGMICYQSDDDKLRTYSGAAWAELSGFTWTGSTANGLATYGTASTVVAESTATYDGTTLELTQSGGGLKMDGLASSNANTLDDYEEGTWTGTVLASTSGTLTLSATNNTCSYIRIGRMVFIQGTLELTSVSSPSGTLRIGGLPFTIANDLAQQADRGNITTTVLNMASAVTRGIYTHAAQGQTFYDINDGDGGTSIGSALAAAVDGGSSFVIGGCYYAAA